MDTAKKIYITNREFDELLEKQKNMGYVRRKWYPNMENVNELAQDPQGHFEFILWILESNQEQKLSPEEREVETALQNLLKESVVFL